MKFIYFVFLLAFISVFFVNLLLRCDVWIFLKKLLKYIDLDGNVTKRQIIISRDVNKFKLRYCNLKFQLLYLEISTFDLTIQLKYLEISTK